MSPKLLNILLIISSWVLYNYVIDPLYFGTDSFFIESGQDIKGLVQKSKTYDKTIEIVPGLIKQAKLDQENFENILEKDKKNILVMVPVSVNEIKLMNEIANIGTDSGLVLDGMGVKDKGGGFYSISFSVITTYTKFKKFITYWENSMRLLTLQSVSFSPGKTEEDEVKFSVELTAYYMK